MLSIFYFYLQKDADYSAVDVAIEKANALNASDYVDFTGVTAAIDAVERRLKSDNQAKVDAMAEAIENAIKMLVKAENPKNDSTKPTTPTDDKKNNVSSPQTGDNNMAMLYILLLGSSILGLTGITALSKKKRDN